MFRILNLKKNKTPKEQEIFEVISGKIYSTDGYKKLKL